MPVYSCRMTINKIPLPPVGADLSCTPPIYRPTLITIRRGEGGEGWLGGPLWSPGGGACSLSIDELTSSRDPLRATIKAQSTSTEPPSPLQLMHIRHHLRTYVTL